MFSFLLLRFLTKLDEISKIIAKRNETRPEKYPYLDPKEIPNAISIWWAENKEDDI